MTLAPQNVYAYCLQEDIEDAERIRDTLDPNNPYQIGRIIWFNDLIAGYKCRCDEEC